MEENNYEETQEERMKEMDALWEQIQSYKIPKKSKFGEAIENICECKPFVNLIIITVATCFVVGIASLIGDIKTNATQYDDFCTLLRKEELFKNVSDEVLKQEYADWTNHKGYFDIVSDEDGNLYKVNPDCPE